MVRRGEGGEGRGKRGGREEGGGGREDIIRLLVVTFEGRSGMLSRTVDMIERSLARHTWLGGEGEGGGRRERKKRRVGGVRVRSEEGGGRKKERTETTNLDDSRQFVSLH
jgi:hypothetical protein